MKCSTHAEVEATAYCRTCGRPICTDCKRDVRGVIYCENCLARDMAAKSAPGAAHAPSDTGAPNPGLAFGLGFIPGVGAIYNGQFAKAFVHVVVFGLLISIVDSREVGQFGPLFGMMIPAFIVYMAFEAYHTARKRREGMVVDEWSGILQAGSPWSRSTGAFFLIGLGVVFLLSNLDIVSIGTIFKFWPLILIGLGASMLANRMGGARPPSSGASPESSSVNPFGGDHE
jgi:hypothetical protein